MMIGTALNLLIITIETICFFMFCDIFAKEDETDAILSAKGLRYIVILSLISYVTDYFFGDYMVLKQILIHSYICDSRKTVLELEGYKIFCYICYITGITHIG